MNYQQITDLAEETVKKYNPGTVSPFPFENIEKEVKDLQLYLVELPEEISGAIRYDEEAKLFDIYINSTKSPTRQHFTTAHEVGHYFLHKESIKEEELVIDRDNNLDVEKMLFRMDDVAVLTQREREANNFAASLIMPEDWVKKAWNELQNIEDCASVFHVSTIAMTIRLEKLGLVK